MVSETEIERIRRAAPQARDLVSDSRRVRRGDVFVALSGLHHRASEFIAAAEKAGCAAILTDESEPEMKTAVPLVRTAHLKEKLAGIAADFYGNPSRDLLGVAVTGTNGKTSTSQWLARLLTDFGYPAAAIGTLGCEFRGEKILDCGLTTPDAVNSEKTLAELRDRGAKAFAVEASSIGLEQGRLDGVVLKAALFTNLTRDHLDYHKTMENYARAKMRLFERPEAESAVINLDDPAGASFAGRAAQLGKKVIGYAKADGKGAALYCSDIAEEAGGVAFTMHFEGRTARVKTALYGLFNVENLLGAAGVMLALGFDFERIAQRLAELTPPAGRMQQVKEVAHPLVIVDYAHTPDALEKAAAALRGTVRSRGGKLWVLIGAGGDRDPGKRSLMGEVAAKSDCPVLTTDNPRSEDPKEILRMMREGAPHALVIEDRAEAIYHAVKCAAPEDVVLIAGKGHETYQEINGVRHHFSDAEEAVSAYRRLKDTE
jgi:UDP-N-acetylmuramyl-tripeptide synthetase